MTSNTCRLEANEESGSIRFAKFADSLRYLRVESVQRPVLGVQRHEFSL